MSCRLRPLARQEVRELDVRADRELGLPTLVLMENAGRGAAAWLAECAGGDVAGGQVHVLPRVLILCGPGNNGGDGGVVARHLDAWGFPVQIVWFADPGQLRGDPKTQWSILERSGVEQSSWFFKESEQPDFAGLTARIAAADWLVDGLLGTGLTRPVEGVLRTVIEAMNDSGKPILALDLPSGLDADTGRPLGSAVRARATATFVAPKLGFSAPGAGEFTGKVAVIDIGLPRVLLGPFLM